MIRYVCKIEYRDRPVEYCLCRSLSAGHKEDYIVINESEFKEILSEETVMPSVSKDYDRHITIYDNTKELEYEKQRLQKE